MGPWGSFYLGNMARCLACLDTSVRRVWGASRRRRAVRDSVIGSGQRVAEQDVTPVQGCGAPWLSAFCIWRRRSNETLDLLRQVCRGVEPVWTVNRRSRCRVLRASATMRRNGGIAIGWSRGRCSLRLAARRSTWRAGTRGCVPRCAWMGRCSGRRCPDQPRAIRTPAGLVDGSG